MGKICNCKAIISDYTDDIAIPELPLEGNAKSDVFKVYMRDTGLLMAMLEEGSQEDIIADIFSKAGKK